MTSFKESAKRIISSVKKRRTGWIVDFADGSCRLIKKTEKKGYAQIKPGMVIESCRSRCNGPDENGNCTWRPMGPRTNNVPQIARQEQFVYAYKPHNFGQEKPKFERGIQKMSYRIKSYRTIKPTKANPVEQVALVFEDGSQKTFLKSVFLGHAVIKHGQHVVPCGEECEQRGGECSYCHGTRRGTLCQQQFYFSRKCLKKHTKDKIK